MKKRNKFLVIILIIFLILGIMYIFFNKEENTITAVNSGIKVFYSSNNNQEENNDQQWILSKEKTEEAMQNNSAVLQGIIDQVSNSGGGTVQLPAGTYYFAPTGTYIENLENGTSEKKAYYVIECRNNVKLVGAGTNESDSNSCTILKPYGMNLDVSLTMFQYINQEQPKVYIENADFADFIVDSNETSKDPNSGYGYVAQGKGFSFSPFKDCDWNNVVVKNTDGTGFGMDLPINSTITNCVAIGCGKAATENDVGASGFGIGTGYSEDESLKISNCEAIGNRKFGFFFEHQGRFVSVIKAKTAKGFLVTDCVARGNMYNFGGEKANDVIYERCVSENSKASDSNPLGNKNTQAFYFGTNSRRIYLEDCSVEQKYSNITDTSVSYYEPVYWAANNSIIDIGESKTEFNTTENCPKAEAVVMLWRMAGRPGEVLTSGEQIDTGYDDVPTNAWFADAVAWAYSEGILDGGTELNAAEDCPRAHFITMLWRYAGSPIVSTGNNYTDVPEGSFYENAVNWGISEGIIESQGTEFQPSISYTKGEILDLLYKYNIINPQKTVVYDYWQNGGTDVDKVYDLKKQNENIDLSVKAQKERYEFVGWSTNKDATQGLSSLTMQTDGIDLYAIYKRDIRITYDANGGDGIPSNQTATMYNNQESINIKLSDFVPTREGYIFKGWTDEQTGTEVKYRSGETYEFKNSATLYAVWDTNELYTLTINPNGGKWNNEISTSQLTGESGTSVQISNPVSPKGYTVTFDGNGGEAEETSKTSTIEFVNWTLEGEGNLTGTTYTFGNGSGTIIANYRDGSIELPGATKSGCRFIGWYTSASGGIKRGDVGDNYVPTENETLYAHWEEDEVEKSYKVTYNYLENGGFKSDKEQDEKETGEKIDLSVEARKEGYEFVGWSTDKNATTGITDLIMGEENVTLYAIFKKDLKITFIDYKGTEENQTIENITIYNNEKGEIDSPKINQYSDWTPRYWTTGREPNSGQAIEEEGLITNIIEGQTYYARYTKEIEISFDLNEGEGSLPELIKGNLEVNSSNINNIQEITITIPDAEISREGFDFVGWMTKKDESGVDYEVGEESSFEESTILYARWAKKSEPSIDNILPVLEIENNSDGKWINQNIKLSITAKDDDSGIEKVTVNDEVILEDEGNVSYIVKQNGTYNIEAVDKAGNITRKTITISNIDKTSPNIYEIERLTNVKEGYTDITVKSIDDDSGINVIEYSYDNEFWNDCLDKNVQKDFDVISYTYKTGESTITIRLKGTEDVTIYFRPIDVANNIGEARSITLNFDFPGDDNDNNDDNNNSINENSINNNLVNSSNNLNISSNEIEDGRSDKNLPFVGLRNTVVIFIIILCITTVFLIKRNNDFKDVK